MLIQMNYNYKKINKGYEERLFNEIISIDLLFTYY